MLAVTRNGTGHCAGVDDKPPACKCEVDTSGGPAMYPPGPAGAQVADIADVVRQRADALMLSGESAAGAYPEKAIGVLRAVATRIEEWCRCVPPRPRPAPHAASGAGSCSTCGVRASLCSAVQWF